MGGVDQNDHHFDPFELGGDVNMDMDMRSIWTVHQSVALLWPDQHSE